MENGCNANAVYVFRSSQSVTEFHTLATVGSASLLAGAVAAVSGFGIGSLLTPVLVFLIPMPTAHAVAVLAVPHALATAILEGGNQNEAEQLLLTIVETLRSKELAGLQRAGAA